MKLLASFNGQIRKRGAGGFILSDNLISGGLDLNEKIK
jgi:hypothetical protein